MREMLSWNQRLERGRSAPLATFVAPSAGRGLGVGETEQASPTARDGAKKGAREWPSGQMAESPDGQAKGALLRRGARAN